jgi:hypothetical protein
MFRIHLLSRVVFSLVLPSRRELENRVYAGTFYIGLGDQFDDDRRLVREPASALHPAMRPGDVTHDRL